MAEQRSPKPQVAGSIPVRPARQHTLTHERYIQDGSGRTARRGRRVRRHPREEAWNRGLLRGIALFFRQVIAELRKVVTPTRKELVKFTAVVLVFVLIVMGIVYGLDTLFAWVTHMVFGVPGA